MFSHLSEGLVLYCSPAYKMLYIGDYQVAILSPCVKQFYAKTCLFCIANDSGKRKLLLEKTEVCGIFESYINKFFKNAWIMTHVNVTM